MITESREDDENTFRNKGSGLMETPLNKKVI